MNCTDSVALNCRNECLLGGNTMWFAYYSIIMPRCAGASECTVCLCRVLQLLNDK